MMQRNQLVTLPGAPLSAFMARLLEVLRDIMDFATQLSADNYCTWILDDPRATRESVEQRLQVDCRGHFYRRDEAMRSVGALLQGNTLIESLEGDDPAETASENILVVAFYLVTREAG